MRAKNKKSFFSLLFVIALDNLGFGLPFILFAPLMLDPAFGMLSADVSFATRNILLGILFAAFPFMQLFGAPIFGDVADFFGRKKALYITIAGSAFAYLLSAFAVYLPNLTLLVISRLIAGFFAGNQSVCVAAIADMSPTEKARSRNFGFMAVALGLGWPLSMLAGGYLSDPTAYRYFNPSLPFLLATLLSLINILIIWKYYLETHVVKKKIKLQWLKGMHHIKEAFMLKGVRILFIVLLLWVCGWVFPNQWLGAYTILEFAATQQMITWVMVFAGIGWTLGGLIFNPFLMKYFSSRTTAGIGFVLTCLFVFLSFLPTSYPLFIAFFSIASIFASFVYSNTLNLISIHASEDLQGATMGLSTSVMCLGFILISIFGGMLGKEGMRWLLPGSAAVLAMGLFVLLSHRKN